MPYSTNDTLPLSLRHVLPPHAQDIYRAAFNNAYDRYGGAEARAHRIAWAAVKRRYEKRDHVWVEKERAQRDDGLRTRAWNAPCSRRAAGAL